MGLTLAAPDPSPAPPCEPPTVEEIRRRCAPGVRRILRRYCLSAHDLPDLEQDVFLSVHRDLANCETPDEPWPWVHGIARNAGRRHNRSRRREEAKLDHGADATAVAAALDEEPDTDEKKIETQRALMMRLIRELRNLARREILLRHFIEGEPVADIASALGRPLRTIEWQRNTGVQELKAAMARHQARERHAATKQRRAIVLPIFGVVDMLRALGRSEPTGAPVRRPWAGALVVVGCVAVVIASVFFYLSARSARAPVEVRPDVTVAVMSAASLPESPAPPAVTPFSPSAPAASVAVARTERIPSEHEVLDTAKRALGARNVAGALAVVEGNAGFLDHGDRAELRAQLRNRTLQAAMQQRAAKARAASLAAASPNAEQHGADR